MKKKIMLGIAMIMLLSYGCGSMEAKVRDLEFVVVTTDQIPAALSEAINERKEEVFKISYKDGEFLYIAMGYGRQATGGYSVSVGELYLTENAVYFDTTLLGPDPGEPTASGESFPYIVIKTEQVDKPVVFE